MSQGTQALTDISITGDQMATTGMGGVTGGVKQVANTTLNIAGASTFIADTKTAQEADLSGAANVFSGKVSFLTKNGGSWSNATLVALSALTMGTTQVTGFVNIDTKGTFNINTPGPLTFGTIKTGSDSKIITQGKVDLGTATFEGTLDVTSGDFEITQSGPGKFGGNTNFDAGTAKIDLFNPFNLWKGSIVYKGGIVMINHPQLLNATNAGTLIVRVETTVVTPASAPKVVVAAVSPAAKAPEQGSIPKGADIAVSVNRAPSSVQSGLVTVTVSSEVAANGKGFAFALLDHIPADMARSTQVSVSQIDGKPLPDWLRFEPATQKVIATSPPPGAFPIQIKANLGGVETVIVITEQPK
jgi:hypothetical protein